MPRYSDYLASPEWQKKRDAVMKRDNFTCACGRPAQDVHHKSYDRIFQESLYDLISICRGCHEFKHGIRTEPLPDYDMGTAARRLRYGIVP